MSILERIIATGNRGPGHDRNTPNWIVCRDGFRVSVLAGGNARCTPRPDLCLYPGPYTHVEIGFPSVRPEPWGEWAPYMEDLGDTDPTGAVYSYVPVDMVRALIESHGGAT